MTTTYTHTREVLDLLGEGNPVRLGCVMHPEAGVEALYEGGLLKLACRECESVASVVEVAKGVPLGFPLLDDLGPASAWAMAGEGR